MKVITLMENESFCGLAAGWGLSQYIETEANKILFDMGPDDGFIANAEALGADLAGVDAAVLSHGHSDHGGGIKGFCACNDKADIYVRPEAFGAYYAAPAGEEPKYIGLEPDLHVLAERMVNAEDGMQIAPGLTLLCEVPNTFPLTPVARKLQEKTAEGFRLDTFAHEQHLLVETEGKAVLFAGCAHGGIVNVLRAAEKKLGRRPDVVFGGFHLFELLPEDPSSREILLATAQEMAAGETVYYTGHCTGEYAYSVLQEVLGERLRPMHAGTVTEL